MSARRVDRGDSLVLLLFGFGWERSSFFYYTLFSVLHSRDTARHGRQTYKVLILFSLLYNILFLSASEAALEGLGSLDNQPRKGLGGNGKAFDGSGGERQLDTMISLWM